MFSYQLLQIYYITCNILREPIDLNIKYKLLQSFKFSSKCMKLSCEESYPKCIYIEQQSTERNANFKAARDMIVLWTKNFFLKITTNLAQERSKNLVKIRATLNSVLQKKWTWYLWLANHNSIPTDLPFTLVANVSRSL